MLPPDKTATWQEDLGYQLMCAWIGSGNLPRAVMTYTDQIGYGVLRACYELSLRATRGRRRWLRRRTLQPALASLGQTSRDLGHPAADMLPIRLIERASPGRDVLMAVEGSFPMPRQ